MLRVAQIHVAPGHDVPRVNTVAADESQETATEHAGPQPFERGIPTDVELPDHVLVVDVVGDDLLETAYDLPAGVHDAAANEQIDPTLPGGRR